ncbi:MAG TPA: hypothetical protein VMU10_00080 [Desulfomonilia bacterium]|nr:hypothetical protein [Desulfomonilia bacterium]
MTWAHLVFGHDNRFPVPNLMVIRFITDHLKGMDKSMDQKLIDMCFKKKPGPHILNTVCRRIASLSAAHEALKVENPCRTKEVRTLLSKARRASVKKEETSHEKNELTRDLLDLLISTCDESLIESTKSPASIYSAIFQASIR